MSHILSPHPPSIHRNHWSLYYFCHLGISRAPRSWSQSVAFQTGSHWVLCTYAFSMYFHCFVADSFSVPLATGPHWGIHLASSRRAFWLLLSFSSTTATFVDSSFRTHLNKLQRSVYNPEMHSINLCEWISREAIRRVGLGEDTRIF